MRIGELARRSGVSVRALRYYEEQGLLTPGRSPGGQREYTEDAVGRVRIFRQFYAAGLSSRRIAELLPCIDSGTTTDHQWAMLNAERTRIRREIDQLTATLARLDRLVGAAADRRSDRRT
ncbi:MerR family transcriptional regulator [Streptomyces armeniacus]|uniref:MerR family transcriptional regulator n=1 Tax=Streptomyces armeniacus TaxID=83291 RepID=A0A345XYM7_9ACTN|nr:MerR family transcriptional regulator [Streptomyces armeniacus]AXK36743.1 MerR family transcriptional regulator [Streptomyces armeniacus]